MKIKTICITLFAALLSVGCGHHRHHRDHGGERRHGHDSESLVGKAIKYPFRITGYALSAPFHPFKSTRKAFNATLDLPEKVVDSTAEALFGHDHKHRDKDSDGDDKKEAKRGDADKGDDKGK